MIAFIIGCVVGFITAFLILFMYASLRVGGDHDE